LIKCDNIELTGGTLAGWLIAENILSTDVEEGINIATYALNDGEYEVKKIKLPRVSLESSGAINTLNYLTIKGLGRVEDGPHEYRGSSYGFMGMI